MLKNRDCKSMTLLRMTALRDQATEKRNLATEIIELIKRLLTEEPEEYKETTRIILTSYRQKVAELDKDIKRLEWWISYTAGTMPFNSIPPQEN